MTRKQDLTNIASTVREAADHIDDDHIRDEVKAASESLSEIASGIDLSKLAEPFPSQDIEWRVSRAGVGRNGVYCNVLAYITARAIQQRLDDVCGPANWRNEPMSVHEVRAGLYAIEVGISIQVGDADNIEWITKYDVSEPTNIEAAKGGFSGAMKRAGAQWGIGRYLYHLDETFAETSEERQQGWTYAKLNEKQGGQVYYWKPPQLPAWALPKEEEADVSRDELNSLKRQWKDKFAPDSKNRSELVEGFDRFVSSVVGDFPASDHTCWTQHALEKCLERISNTVDPDGVSSDVPFESA